MAKRRRSERPAERFYDLPFSAVAPRLINLDLGLPNLVSRTSPQASFSIDVTLLDTPDHRLLRSGVLLAHRVLDGRGEWYLGAPEWAPLLPNERVESMGHGDLPAELADLVMPFRRRGTLGPVAALTCDRREFAFKSGRDARGGSVVLAMLRDERVTISRGGLITARYREVTLRPTNADTWTQEQTDWVDRALFAAGATRVPAFPPLPSRLGAPATGQTDFPVPRAVDAESNFAGYVSALLTRRVEEIVRADLAIRSGADPESAAGAEQLAAAAGRLAGSLRGLAPALDPDWLADLDEELIWLSEQAASPGPADSASRSTTSQDAQPERLLALLRRERYLNLLERLVTAARGPRLGDSTELPAVEVLETLQDTALARFWTIADRLTVRGSQADWSAAVAAAEEWRLVHEVVVDLLGKPARKLGRRLRPVLAQLSAIADHTAAAEALRTGVAELEPIAAFESGRRYEVELGALWAAREDFCTAWGKAVRKLES